MCFFVIVTVYLFKVKLHVTVYGKYSLYFSFILLPVAVQVQYDPILLWIFNLSNYFNYFNIN